MKVFCEFNYDLQNLQSFSKKVADGRFCNSAILYQTNRENYNQL